jgi:hypothetical protein
MLLYDGKEMIDGSSATARVGEGTAAVLAGTSAQWQHSGLSQAEYCRQQQPSATTFDCWKARLTAPTRGAAPTVSPRTTGGRMVPSWNWRSPAEMLGAIVGEVVYEIVLARHRQLRLGRHSGPD